MSHFLQVESVEKRFADTVALNGLSFDIGENSSIVGILGRNGAGKSTFLKILTGFMSADAGQVIVSVGEERLPFAGATHATVLSERSTIVPRLTGWQYLHLHATLNQLAGVATNWEYQQHLIEELELEPHLGKYIARMSKGNHRKMEVVAAMAARTPLVIADELGEGLDFPSLTAVCRTIRQAAQDGRRFVISSHDLSFVGDVCDEVVVIDSGRCVACISAQGDLSAFAAEVKEAFASGNE